MDYSSSTASISVIFECVKVSGYDCMLVVESFEHKVNTQLFFSKMQFDKRQRFFLKKKCKSSEFSAKDDGDASAGRSGWEGGS